MNKIELLISELVKMNDNELTLHEVSSLYLRRSKQQTRIDTYKYYKVCLKPILDYLNTIGIRTTGQLSNDSLFKYIEYEKSKNLKNNTINKRLGTLKQALAYCEKNELIPKSPMRNFDLLSRDDTETIIIDHEILKRIFSYFSIAESTEGNIRTQAMIYILLDTGIRLNELRMMKTKDIDLSKNQIELRYTKTKKNRTLFISDKTNEIISNYLRIVSPGEYFLINLDDREQISRQGMYKSINRLKKKLKIPQSVSLSFHKFRHTYATTCLEQGATLEFLRKTLGHSELSTTQKYLHLSKTRLQSEHNNCSPLNLY